MQRIPNTIEEQLILKAINEECPWENLPKRLQATLTSKEEWHRRIIEHCIKKRLQWNKCFARISMQRRGIQQFGKGQTPFLTLLNYIPDSAVSAALTSIRHCDTCGLSCKHEEQFVSTIT
ncbi:hypothetical protein Patl1_08576 [Pistacia atlantica]|uniref:Uncharacterized protein n=1 Tax=Pistacia atlantica TaxID=434234 RepID=A0ACC1AL60_9ROSI|nr:hypothetical protein Patl1_08576 [Pistacia atlantica]